jgi:ribosomal protein S21
MVSTFLFTGLASAVKTRWMPGKIEVEAGESIAYALVRFRKEATRDGLKRIGPRVPGAIKHSRVDYYQTPSEKRRLREYRYAMRRRRLTIPPDA